MKIRATGVIQRYDFPIYDRIGGKIAEHLSDLRESLAEVLAVPRVENGFAAGPDTYGPIAVQLDFVGPIRTFGKIGNQSAFHWLDKFGFPFRMRLSLCACVSAHEN